MSFVAFFQFILSVETFLTGDWPLLFQIQQSGEWRILDFNSPLGCYDIMLITYSYCSCPTSSWPIKQTIVKTDLFSLIYRIFYTVLLKVTRTPLDPNNSRYLSLFVYIFYIIKGCADPSGS